jgi:hypothetical protein
MIALEAWQYLGVLATVMLTFGVIGLGLLSGTEGDGPVGVWVGWALAWVFVLAWTAIAWASAHLMVSP